MVHFAGHWAEPTLEGDRPIWLDGVVVYVPDDADCKLVHAHHRVTVLHVKHLNRVHVFTAMGQLQETDEEARRRALPTQWAMVSGERI